MDALVVCCFKVNPLGRDCAMQTPLWFAAISAAGEEMPEGLECRFGKEETVPPVFIEANTFKHGERFRAPSKFPETDLIFVLVRGVFELHTF